MHQVHAGESGSGHHCLKTLSVYMIGSFPCNSEHIPDSCTSNVHVATECSQMASWPTKTKIDEVNWSNYSCNAHVLLDVGLIAC